MRPRNLMSLGALVTAGLLVAARPPEHEGDHHPVLPMATAPWAKPSDNGGYIMNLVGGGNWRFRRAEGPAPDEGTWGWDFQGLYFPRRILLGWWHGRYQGGTGAYKTDGPHIFKQEE